MKYPLADPHRLSVRNRFRSLLFPILLFLVLPGHPSELLAHGESRQVLILNSYHQGYAWSDQIMEGIREEFARSGLQVDLSFEYLDAQQHDPARVFPPLEELYRTKFADRQASFEVVIAADNPALDFILPRRELLAPGVPLVFTGINDYHDDMLAGQQNITGVVERIDLPATIRAALELHPQTRNLAVVSDVTPTGKINFQRFLEIKPDLPADLRIIELAGLTAGELARELAALPDHTVILNLSFYRDPTGRIFSPDGSMALLLENSRAPIYTAWGFLVRRGAMGGIVVSGFIQGQEAARMAIAILRGRPADRIPILRESPNVPMFNYHQMQRFGIGKADLPAGSRVVEEPQTFYHQYWWALWSAAALLLLEAAIITGLFVNILRRRKAEAELTGYRAQLEELVRERTAELETAVRSLRESEEKYRSVVERANDGIFILQGDRFRYANPAMASLLGYSREELLELTLDEILPPEQYRQVGERHLLRVAGKPVPRKYETTLLARNGERIQVEFNAGLINYQDHLASLVFVRDLKERLQLEEERAKVSKLESIGVLAGGIAHDFNNLLTGVLGSVSLLQTMAAKGSRTASLLGQAEKATLRARDLASQLITFSQGGAPRQVRLELREILEQATEAALSATGSQAEFHLDPDLRPVTGDREQILQLVAILVTNAGEAMAGAGRVKITAGNVELQDQEVNQLPAGGYVRFSCVDTGIGIPPEHLPKLFDPYFSTKTMGARKGTGLGLSIAYSIVRRHRGHIEVHSRPDEGTSVSVYLPACSSSRP